MTDFDNKLKNLYKNVTSNKTTKLAKGLVNKFSALNGANKFSSGIFQNYLVFFPAKNTLNILVALLELIRVNLMECQKKILKM